MNTAKVRLKSRRTKKQPKTFRSIWLAPTISFLVISSMTLVSFVAQSETAKNKEFSKNSEIKTEAQEAISSRMKNIEKLGQNASRYFNVNPELFADDLNLYIDGINLDTQYSEVAFVAYVPPANDSQTPGYKIALLSPSKNDSESGISTDHFLNASPAYITNLNQELQDALTTGEVQISLPFVNNMLMKDQSTFIALVIPIFTEVKDVNGKTIQEQYSGAMVVPVALDLFLDSAREHSINFRLFRLMDSEKNAIATSNTDSSTNELSVSSTSVKINQRTFRFEYDNYKGVDIEGQGARKSLLVTGFGLAFVVFLLFSMMRLSEIRSRKLAEDAEREVYESEARFSALIEKSSDITLVLDTEGLITFASPSIRSNLGYTNEEVVGKNILEIAITSQTRKIVIESIAKLKKGESVDVFEAHAFTKDGTKRIFECVINDLRDEDAVAGIVCNSRDITERKLAESQAIKAKALYENALENAPIGIALAHQDGECFFVNEALETFLGVEFEDFTSSRLQDFVSLDDKFAFTDMWKTLESRGDDRTTKELRFEHPDGRNRWGLISAQGVYDEDVFQYYVVQIEDTTERRSIAERLEYQAIHDPLTGLPNRLLFVDRLEVALLRAKRTGLGIAVLFIDLDRFKVVNDSLGHAAGDRLLVAVTERIKASVRPNDTIARFGGDEFVILCEDISDEKQTQEISSRLLENINRPIMLVEGEVYVTASIGVARSLANDDTPETILRDADTAMYRAKDAGRNRMEVFDERTHARAVANLETGNGMFRALSQDEFRVRYQPIISLSSGRLSGFEALVYWQHPERGHVNPIEFIPLAEETGVIVPLGLKIFEEACSVLHKWHGYSENASHLTMSINLSPRQFAEPNFADEINKILKRTKVNPSRVWFEITESALMVDTESTISMLEQLRTLGVHFEVDDFGTGFSSLSYLKKFPVDALKIDQGFVDGLGIEPEDTAIVTAVVSLSHALGLQAIAEGVETPLQMAELKTLGCEYAQGYLFARPDVASAWDEVVKSNELFTFADEQPT